MTFEPFVDATFDPSVRGFIHRPTASNGACLVLAHGAGANSQSPLLLAMGEAFTAAGFTTLRADLPFRQARPQGPPRPGDAAKDRTGLANAVAALRREGPSRIFLGGHSYGGRQATMLAADDPQLVEGLLLLSYPLHPPRKPEQLRTQHLPKLRTPAMFVHGTRDPFGSIAEMESALDLIPAKHLLTPVQGSGHDLGIKKKDGHERDPLLRKVADQFQNFIS